MSLSFSHFRLLGTLFARLSVPLVAPVEGMEPPDVSLVRLLCFHLGTKSGLQRLVTGLVVQEWAQAQQVSLVFSQGSFWVWAQPVRNAVHFLNDPCFTDVRTDVFQNHKHRHEHYPSY